MSGRRQRRAQSQPHYTLDGVLFILSLVLVAAFVAFQFRGTFIKSVDVDLLAPRSGLNLEPGTRVKMLDVQVGRVAKVEEVDGYAKVELDLFPEQVDAIPVNVAASLDSTTVFGAKYVNLTLPKDASETKIGNGDTIDARNITPELNTLFERLTTVLRAVSPEDLNATLTAVADAFRDRGEQVGNTLVAADSYLNALRPSLDNLQRDLVGTADVADIYADAAPSLLSSVESLTTTGSTILEKADDLDRFLLAAIDFGNSGSTVLNDNEAVVAILLRNLVPTTELLEEYSPEFPCFFQGVDEARAGVEQVVGGTVPGFNISGTLLAGDMPYRYPRDVPKVAASGGPACGRLPSVNVADGPAPYVVTDTGVNPFAPNGRPAQLNVLDFMLYGVPGGLR
ncbi:MCE family protein [Antrihabitans sp. YC2-6]|uniref:MCE family protein n=1 Tax=Antrihabitans sp. YC2-6 TaxID=2799498 RepID=UPI0018F6562C|nr:MCE family protein [Antrihabitans sp. YC2-6]MBJ8344667.1 MCE family protein [Antrihabitans sp. YC2-6]